MRCECGCTLADICVGDILKLGAGNEGRKIADSSTLIERIEEARTLKCLRVLIFAAVFFCGVSCAYGQNSPCKLPAPLGHQVAQSWKGWRLMQLSDLRADDQDLWRKKWGNRCPGLASGHFVNPDSLVYAVSLVDPKGSRQAIILASPRSDGSFTTQVISPASRFAAFSVVHTLPPGRYNEVEGGRKVRTKLDSIAYETIEAGMVMFYEENGKFRMLQLSE